MGMGLLTPKSQESAIDSYICSLYTKSRKKNCIITLSQDQGPKAERLGKQHRDIREAPTHGIFLEKYPSLSGKQFKIS